MLKRMKKLTPIMFVAIVLFLIMPIGKSFAASFVDGEYDMTANALHANKDEPSVAADYINEGAKVIVNGGEVELQITVPKSEEFSMYSLKKQGASEKKSEDDSNLYYKFNLDENDINSTIINVVTSYEVPSMDFVHENVDFRFQINGLDKIEKESGNGEKDESEEKTNGDNDVSDSETEGNDSKTGGKEKDNSEEKTEDNPKTGDETPIILLTIVLLGSGAFLVRKFTVK